jgi:stage II sporulation protein D
VLIGHTVILLLLAVFTGGCKKRQLVTPTPQMDTDPQYWVRVLLVDDVNNCTVEIPSVFTVNSEDPDLQKQVELARFGKSRGPVNILLIDSVIKISDKTFSNEQIIISPDEPYIFNMNGKKYRGKLKLITNPDGVSFDGVNIIPIESYLAGVAGAEMPNYWEPEALKAQVIAARTYCLYTKKRFGQNRKWDVGKTAAHQVYKGIDAESAAIWNAVNQTKGMVLTCKQSNGKEDIFPSYYSSTCGGHTENSKNVFGDSFPPLDGVSCPYCKDVAKPKFFFWPMYQIDKSDATSRLFQRYEKIRQLGDINDINIARETDYGDFSRSTMIELLSSNGDKELLRAEDFRLAIDSTGRKIKSACFQLEDLDDCWAFLSGRGWGHGVGMCQCGAEGMARQGKTARQILSYYYPESKILKIEY